MSAAIITSSGVTKTPTTFHCLVITWTHSRGTAPRHRQRRPPSGRSCHTCRWFLRSHKERTHGSAAQRTSEVTACWAVRSCCPRRCDPLPPRLSPGGHQSRETTLRLLYLPIRQKEGVRDMTRKVQQQQQYEYKINVLQSPLAHAKILGLKEQSVRIFTHKIWKLF